MNVSSLTLILHLAMLLSWTQPQSKETRKPPASVEKGDRIQISAAEIENLGFQELFDSSTRELKPSTKLLSLNGKRVRMIGFMAQMETQPEGAFYLCPHPVYADESGAGTGELPIGSVRVKLTVGKNQKPPHINRAIEVTGILEVGNQMEDDGSVSSIRLLLDPSPPQHPKRPKNRKNPH